MATLSPESLESFREKHQELATWREQYLADLIWRVLPEDDVWTWEQAAREAVRHHENGSDLADGDPMFERYSDSFVTVAGIMNRRGDIRNRLAEDRKFIYTDPGKGIRKPSTTEEVRQTLSGEARVVEGLAERYNFRAELANKHRKAGVPTFRTALLPPGEKEQ